jgi:hypothetical protein
MRLGVMPMNRLFMWLGNDVFGLAFDRKSKLTVASSGFVTAMILACSLYELD